LPLYRLGFEQANHFTQNCLESANLINPTEDQYFAAIAKAKQFPDQTITIVDALTAINRPFIQSVDGVYFLPLLI